MEAFLISLAINIAIQLLTPVPKLPGAKRYGLNDFDVPTASEDRAWTYGVGTFQVAGNVVWMGDYKATPITQEVRVNWFKTTTQILGWRYCVGLWMTLCVLPCDELTEIWSGDRIVWSGSQVLSKTAVTEVAIDKKWTSSEGQEAPEGMKGRFLFFNHAVADGADFEQLPCEYLDAMLGEGTYPAYPNTLHVVWVGPSGGSESGWLSNGPQIQPLRFTLKRAPNLAQPGLYEAGFPASTPLLPNGDAPLGPVLLELMCGRSSGLGPRISPWAMDLASFGSSGEHGVSFTWETSKPVAEIVQQLCDVAACALDTDEATGRVTARAMGEALVGSAGRTLHFDDSNTIEVESRVLDIREDMPNQIVVPWVDRSRNWQSRQAFANNRAGQRGANGLLQRTVEYLGVCSEQTATYLASRAMRNLGAARPRYRVRAHSGGSYALSSGGVYPHVGDRANIVDPVNGATVIGVITSSQIAAYENSVQFQFECWAGDWAAGIAGSVDTPGDTSGETLLPVPLVDAVVMRAPYALTLDDADHPLYYAMDPNVGTTNFRLAVQENRISWSTDVDPVYSEQQAEPAISGVLTAAVGATESDTSFDLQLTESGMQQWRLQTRRTLFLLAGDEWMTCSSWALDTDTRVLTATGVARGIFDTVPAAYAAGASVTLLLGYVIDDVRLKTVPTSGEPYGGLEGVVCRAESRGPNGVVQVEDAADSEAVLADAGDDFRALRPLAPGAVKLDGVMASLHADSPAAVIRAASLPLTWANRRRTAATTTSWFGAYDGGETYQLTHYRLAYPAADGIWVETEDMEAAPGVNSVMLDLSGVPAGERLVRVTLWASRQDNDSLQEAVCWWELSA
jgi:hypothetical protein